jgi:hypothetical protein
MHTRTHTLIHATESKKTRNEKIASLEKSGGHMLWVLIRTHVQRSKNVTSKIEHNSTKKKLTTTKKNTFFGGSAFFYFSTLNPPCPTAESIPPFRVNPPLDRLGGLTNRSWAHDTTDLVRKPGELLEDGHVA